MRVGDLVQTTLGWTALVVARDTQTKNGQYWWRVYNCTQQNFRIVLESEMEVMSESR